MHQPGKLENINQEAARLKVDMMGLAKVRWLDSGKLISDYYIFIYAGHNKEHKHGVGQLLNEVVGKSVMGYHAIFNIILLVKLLGKPFN